jgi:hypothetical protein
MKTAKVSGNPPHQARRRASVRHPQGKAIPPEARRSTGASLSKHAPGWAGDDLEDVIEIVTQTRVKTRF